jgi:hypothetical protein
VEFESDGVTVRVCTADNQGSYAFRCPECGLAVAKPADSRVVDLLITSGARVEVWDLPAEMGEVHYGGPITYDDILEFHYAIQQEGWFERLVESVRDEDRG